jgi:hypothetical protein
MPTSPSSRLGLIAPAGGDNISIGDDQIRAIVDALDPIVGIHEQGTLGVRPISTPGSPGIRDRYYWATDTAQLFRDNGTGWDLIGPVGPDTITLTDLAASATQAFLKLNTPSDAVIKPMTAVGSVNTFGNTTRCNGKWAHGLGRTPIWADVESAEVDTFAPSETSAPVGFGRTTWDATYVYAKCVILNGGSSNNAPVANLLVIG